MMDKCKKKKNIYICNKYKGLNLLQGHSKNNGATMHQKMGKYDGCVGFEIVLEMRTTYEDDVIMVVREKW